MPWIVEFHDAFGREFAALDAAVKIELRALVKILMELGPAYGRPRVDTLKGSKFANMKELRFDAAEGVWRVAFAFDPERKAILLVAGDKSGVNEKRFYRRLITVADNRFADHLSKLEATRGRT